MSGSNKPSCMTLSLVNPTSPERIARDGVHFYVQEDRISMTENKDEKLGTQDLLVYTYDLPSYTDMEKFETDLDKKFEKHTDIIPYNIDERMVDRKIKEFVSNHGFEPSTYDEFKKIDNLSHDVKTIEKPDHYIDLNGDDKKDIISQWIIYGHGKLRNANDSSYVGQRSAWYAKRAIVMPILVFDAPQPTKQSTLKSQPTKKPSSPPKTDAPSAPAVKPSPKPTSENYGKISSSVSMTLTDFKDKLNNPVYNSDQNLTTDFEEIKRINANNSDQRIMRFLKGELKELPAGARVNIQRVSQ